MGSKTEPLVYHEVLYRIFNHFKLKKLLKIEHVVFKTVYISIQTKGNDSLPQTQMVKFTYRCNLMLKT